MSRTSKRLKYILLSTFALISVSCANGHCRKSSEVILPEGPTEATKAASEKSKMPITGQKTIRIFKYDGSLQCAQGTERTLETMKEELNGVQVLKAEKISDGLMRAQVCGQSTGRANVFDIYEKDLAAAEALGFKKWTFY